MKTRHYEPIMRWRGLEIGTDSETEARAVAETVYSMTAFAMGGTVRVLGRLVGWRRTVTDLEDLFMLVDNPI